MIEIFCVDFSKLGLRIRNYLYFCKQLVAETDRKTADYQDVRDWLQHDTPRDNTLKPPNRGLFFF